MSVSLRIFVGIGIVIYFATLFYFLKKGRLILKYTLLWIFGGIVLMVIDLFPELILAFSKFIGIKLASNAIFLLAIFIIVILLISLTSIVSVQNEKIKKLIQHLAILEKRIRELEQSPKKVDTK